MPETCPTAPAPTKGSRILVAWITLLTLGMSLFGSAAGVAEALRPLYFLGIFTFLFGIGLREPKIRSLPFRMIELGLLLIGTGFLVSFLLRRIEGEVFPPETVALIADTLDRGLALLLGFSLIAYGIVLWIPELLESRRILEADLERRKREIADKERRLEEVQEVLAHQEGLAAVGELAAGVAHELRNPFAVLKSALQSMHEEGLGPGDRTHCLRVMERAVDKACLRLRGLLDLGRTKTHAPREVDLLEVVREAMELAGPKAREAEVPLLLESASEPRTAFVDPENLQQALLNLLLNAIQAGPHEGPIEVGVRGHEGGARIEVRDRGQGIPESHLHKAGKAFFTTRPDGTGLGLTVSANLCEKDGGRLSLARRKGGGTLAVIEIPGVSDG